MNLLRDLTLKLSDTCRESIRFNLYGSDWDHIESIVQIPDENGTLMFEVTSWHEMGDKCRVVKKMNLSDVMHEIAVYISAKATREAVGLFG